MATKKTSKTAKAAKKAPAKKTPAKKVAGTHHHTPAAKVVSKKIDKKASKVKAPVKKNKSVHPHQEDIHHHSNTQDVTLSKLAKAKIKQKEAIVYKPRKIEKIIDVARLEKKLSDIMSLDHAEFSVEEKLKALYVLQEIDSDIDKIRTIRGELPIEVTDLEDEIVGLSTRIQNITDEIKTLEEQVNKKKQVIKDAKEAIKKYESQQSKVKNNREFDSLNKEIEFQNLEIQLAEKRGKEFGIDVILKNDLLTEAQSILDEKNAVLKMKKSELESIVEETQKEEDQLHKISQKARSIIDERLLTAYSRVRTNARNGLGVVAIQRDACGGCFNKIPPQRQLDIRQHKKVIVCEHCGRILVDPRIAEEEAVS